MYIKQIANTWRTFGECSLNTHEIGCETLPNSQRPPRNWLRNTPPIPHVHHEIGCETLRQFPTSTTRLVRNTPSGVGDRFIVPVSWHCQNAYSHYQICVYSLSNMCFHIINYVFSSHHAHIFALPYQYIRFLLSIILNIKQPNTAYIYT